MIQLRDDIFLIADPFLKDLNFKRSVVLICEHNQDGSFGLIQNSPTEYLLHQLFQDVRYKNIPVFNGGPIGLNAIHFLHQSPELIPKSVKLNNNLFWGGDFEILKALINTNQIDLQNIKFFIGYSGWSVNQLADELNEKTWLISKSNTDIIFNPKPDEIWKDALKLLGGEFEQLINYPIDPQLN